MSKYDRTFGLEIEFGDIDKAAINLPSGYKWSKEEKSIVNSNAKKATPSGNFGGEINTRPLYFNRSDLRELRSFINQCLSKDAVLMWNTGFDGHIYIGDLGLEDLKKIFALAFFVSPLINDIFNLGEWFNVEHLVPVPTYKFKERVDSANSLEALKNVFANSSNRGHYRFQINIMSYFRTGTLEFRIFNVTKNFRQILESIHFMYSFVDFALNNEEESYRKIKTRKDFEKAFKVKKGFATAIEPLIFAEDHNEGTRIIARAFSPSRKIISCVINSIENKLATVNPYNYEIELALNEEKKLSKIYNNSEFNDVLRRISLGKLNINYINHFEVLNNYKDGLKSTELAIFLLFHRIHKYDLNTEYGKNEFSAYISKTKESIEKLSETTAKLVNLFKSIDYIPGNLNDAMENDKEILFQQEFNSKTNSTITRLKKHSDYESDFQKKEMSYAGIKEKSAGIDNFLIISKNNFLPFHKIAKDLNTILYCNQDKYLGLRAETKRNLFLDARIPDDDFEINENTEIKVNEVKPSYFSILQKNFVKKVTRFKQPKLCYVVLSGEYLLGAFGFDYSSDKEYELFLLSDFCTNNNIKLLSKLILLIIKTQYVKKSLEKRIISKLDKSYTKIYTTMAVSMKYRGVFTKKKTDDKKALVYEFTFGEIKSIRDALKEFVKRKNQSGR